MPIHDGRNLQSSKKSSFSLIKYIIRNKKIILKILIICLVLLLLIFPQESGQLIGGWIRDFFVTMFFTILNG